MTNKSDRQDGDGLLLRRELLADKLVDCISLQGTIAIHGGREMYVSFTKGQIAEIVDTLRLAPSPTRDGAEGAANCPHGNPLYVFCAYCQPSAPPKPAPDAVRQDQYGFENAMFEACARHAQQLCAQEGRTEEWYAATRQVPAKIRALAAPVPSPDDATVVVDQILHQFENDDRTLYPDFEVILALEKIQSALLSRASPTVRG